MRNLKDTIEDRVHQVNPYILFDVDKYQNLDTPMDCYCDKHDFHFTTLLRTFVTKKSLGCYFCKSENKKFGGRHIPNEVVIKVVEDAGYNYCDTFYEDGKCKVHFICPKHQDKGMQVANFQDLRAGKRSCGYCNGTKRTTEDFQIIINEKFNNTLQITGEYTGAKNRVKCKCLVDDYEWSPYAYNLLSGCGCPICGDRKVGLMHRISSEERLKKVAEMNPNVEIITLGETSQDYSTCRCKVCGHIWMATYSNLTHKSHATACPMCNISHNEQRVADLLTSLHIRFIHEYTFEDCVDQRELPFDFYLPDYNTMIEYDGEHHYKVLFGDGKLTAEERLAYVQKHDRMKNEYCDTHGIKLIRIPYWESDNLEAYINIDNISA